MILMKKNNVKQIRGIQREIQKEREGRYGPDHTRPLPHGDKRKKSKYPEKFD